MDTLKKKIIYYYIIITTVLLIAEWYLFCFFSSYISVISENLGIFDLLLEVVGVILAMILFFGVSWIYYRKISRYVAEETQRQVREQNLMFANISHDLKNPMSSVLGFARALEAGNVSDDEVPAVYHTICEKTIQMNDMIQKMFRYAKMESDGYSLDLQETDLCSLLRSIIAERYIEIEQNNIEPEIDLPEKPVNADVDTAELTRLINNLISNVLRHNDSGIKMLVRLEDKESAVRIIIADSGNDIPQEQRRSIFMPFQCSDTSRQTKDGSGLGLAISKRIAELHGGRLYIDDNIQGYTKGFVTELKR